VSLLSPERLSAFVAPDAVLAVRWRGLRPRVVDKRVLPVAAGDANPAHAAAATLAAALAELRPGRVRLILSNHFVHYALVPWRSDLKDADEETALARLGFVETYGEDAQKWNIRLSDEAPGRAKVAAALAPELLDALQRVCAEAKVRLTSVQPYLTAAVSAFRKHFGRDRSAWLALHEEGRLCLALIEHGRWRWVRCIRAGGDWRQQLPEMVENEILLAGAEAQPGQVLVFAPSVAELAVRSGTRLPYHALRLGAGLGFSPITDAAFSPALLG
jgi:hypothetical protein